MDKVKEGTVLSRVQVQVVTGPEVEEGVLATSCMEVERSRQMDISFHAVKLRTEPHNHRRTRLLYAILTVHGPSRFRSSGRFTTIRPTMCSRLMASRWELRRRRHGLPAYRRNCAYQLQAFGKVKLNRAATPGTQTLKRGLHSERQIAHQPISPDRAGRTKKLNNLTPATR